MLKKIRSYALTLIVLGLFSIASISTANTCDSDAQHKGKKYWPLDTKDEIDLDIGLPEDGKYEYHDFDFEPESSGSNYQTGDIDGPGWDYNGSYTVIIDEQGNTVITANFRNDSSIKLTIDKDGNAVVTGSVEDEEISGYGHVERHGDRWRLIIITPQGKRIFVEWDMPKRTGDDENAQCNNSLLHDDPLI